MIHCPKCKCTNVSGEVSMRGRGLVNVNSHEIIDEPRDFDFDSDDIDYFYCNECGYEWDS